ncbi:MAG: cation transporter [bacterium]
MLSSMKTALFVAAGLGGAAGLCPLCGPGTQIANAQAVRVAVQTSDTAVVRMHISGMICGACPTTARLALTRLTGVYGATVTLDDSLGVVRYNPRRASPAQIVAHLTRLTGFRARILADSASTSRKRGAE